MRGLRLIVVLLAAAAVSLGLAGAADGDTGKNVKQDLKSAGRDIGEAGREVGQAAAKLGKKVGLAGKDAGEKVADKAEDAWYKGKKVSRPLLERVQEGARQFWAKVVEGKDKSIAELKHENAELKRRAAEKRGAS